jgi:hypothetical protein
MARVMGYCVADARCAELYGQVPEASAQVFAHLYAAFLVSAGSGHVFDTVEAPLRGLACGGDEGEAALAFVWQAHLRYLAADAAMCAVNERFVLTDPQAGVGACVCIPDRACRVDSASSNLLITYHFVMIALLVGILVLQLVPLGEHLRGAGPTK